MGGGRQPSSVQGGGHRTDLIMMVLTQIWWPCGAAICIRGPCSGCHADLTAILGLPERSSGCHANPTALQASTGSPHRFDNLLLWRPRKVILQNQWVRHVLRWFLFLFFFTKNINIKIPHLLDLFL